MRGRPLKSVGGVLADRLKTASRKLEERESELKDVQSAAAKAAEKKRAAVGSVGH
jgi:hypothetical protein